MIAFIEKDNKKAFEIADQNGLADPLINAQLASDAPDGVLTLIANDPLDKFNYLVVQLFYGHKEEKDNGWVVSQWVGTNAHEEIAEFVRLTMDDPTLVEVISNNEYKM